MKLITYQYRGIEEAGVLARSGDFVYPLRMLGVSCRKMSELIDGGSSLLEKVRMAVKEADRRLPLAEIQLEAPIPEPRQDIICLGINYREHAEESVRFKGDALSIGKTEYATYFSKRVNRATGSGALIDTHGGFAEELDYEAELAVVIGKDACRVAEEDAFDYVFGYTIINDITSRAVQTRHNQWFFGKSLDSFAPMGPCLVTEDEFTRPPILRVTSRVNGELRQNSTTDFMIHGIAEVISKLSQGITLKKGTIIAMGTPAGVGMGFQPPRFLRSGDTVVCEIEGIGILENSVK